MPQLGQESRPAARCPRRHLLIVVPAARAAPVSAGPSDWGARRVSKQGAARAQLRRPLGVQVRATVHSNVTLDLVVGRREGAPARPGPAFDGLVWRNEPAKLGRENSACGFWMAKSGSGGCGKGPVRAAGCHARRDHRQQLVAALGSIRVAVERRPCSGAASVCDGRRNMKEAGHKNGLNKTHSVAVDRPDRGRAIEGFRCKVTNVEAALSLATPRNPTSDIDPIWSRAQWRRQFSVAMVSKAIA